MTTLLFHLSWKHLLWLIVTPILWWPLKTFGEWLRHCFWLGFKATLVSEMKKGSKLTPEEQAAIKQQVQAQIDAEVNARIHSIADPLGINVSDVNSTSTSTLPQDN